MFESERSDGRAEPVRDEPSSGIRIGRTAFPSGGGALHRRWRDSGPLLRTASFAALLSFAAVLGLSRWEDALPSAGAVTRRKRRKRTKSRSLWPKAPIGCSIRHPCQNLTRRSSGRLFRADRPSGWPSSRLRRGSRRAASRIKRPPGRGIADCGNNWDRGVRAVAHAAAGRAVASGGSESSRMAAGQGSRRARTAALAPSAADTRSFFDRLFGVQSTPTPGPALAYAAPESSPRELAPGVKLSPAPTAVGAGDGALRHQRTGGLHAERRAAGGAFRSRREDGRPPFRACPDARRDAPGTYDLTEREKPFHGVRALRLNPVGGSAAIHGRAGLLAHTYLLGPNGQSNGCVSFRQYDKFLQAYLRGEVKRLVVVAGRGQDGPFGHLQQPCRRRRASRPQRVSGRAVARRGAPPLVSPAAPPTGRGRARRSRSPDGRCRRPRRRRGRR